MTKKTTVSRRACLSIALAGVVVTVLTLSFGYHRECSLVSVSATVPTANRSGGRLHNTRSGARHVEAEIVTIKPSGFGPTEIRRPAGTFLLAFDNRSELEEIRLRLNALLTDRVPFGSLVPQIALQQPSLLDITIPRERLDRDELINLPPGTYALTEASHPNWVCYVTITAP